MGTDNAKQTTTARDVARVAQVSHGTVSNVFNKPEIVRPAVRERVLAAAKEVGYRGPDLIGRLLNTGKVNAIGVATKESLTYFFEDPFARALLSSMAAASDAAGVGLSLISARNSDPSTWNINSAVVDGLILLCVQGGAPLVELARARRLPFVAVALSSSDKSIATVAIDQREAGRQAARHLVELGHRNIGVLSMHFGERLSRAVHPEDIHPGFVTTAQERLLGYLDELARVGIDPHDVPVYEADNRGTSVEDGLGFLFNRPIPPTGLLCMSDRFALRAMNWLKTRNVAVPDDVSVVGFDGIAEGQASVPPLTTIAQPIDELGRRAISFILNREPMTDSSVLATKLVMRGSTGPVCTSSRREIISGK